MVEVMKVSGSAGQGKSRAGFRVCVSVDKVTTIG